MNILAEDLNKILAGTGASRLLSNLGKRMYFPKGIISQSAEAAEKAHRFNATIGMSYEKGQPMILDAIRSNLPGLSSSEAVAYAPTAGVLALRKRWKEEMKKKNPSLGDAPVSLPVAVPGLTAGISFLSDLFLDPDDAVVLPDMFWPNYRLIMEERKGARLVSFPMFTPAGGFNVEGFEKNLIAEGKARGKVATILNFPNNPSGYSPTLAEADAIVAALERVAALGVDILVISDDAYFGLQYEEGVLRESLFARLAARNPRILAVKVDGPTKEDYVWGFRSGFITFGGAGFTEEQYDALVKKLMGVVRSVVSSSPAPTQYILLKALDSPGYEAQKARYRKILESRYKKVREFLSRTPAPACLKPFPFNSGYFMSLECIGISAEELRKKLLEKGIGAISMQDKWLRVAFSSVEASDVDALYTEIFAAAKSLMK
jgi:aspartate/methionine/tyrosine aminotransferase